MQIEIFDYVERAAATLEENRDALNRMGARITNFLEDMFEEVDETVSVTYRIKTATSLKEKIVRNAMYKQYEAEKLIYEASDTIGVRLECRFLDDEKLLYERLIRKFNVKRDDAYGVKGRKIFLKLDAPQPERQKNGLEIYRIDGYVLDGEKKYNFELQIKSLVNSFWSEIEHKIIYKNKRFMLIDDFVNELMSSLNDSLKNIDRQLNMLFHRCLDSSQKGQLAAAENMLLGLINELFSRLVEERVGISVNIKPYSQALVKYLLGYSTFARRSDGSPLGDDALPFNETLVRFMRWLKDVDFDGIGVGQAINFDHPFVYENEMQEIIGKKLTAEMNDDFFCNTFFHILFSLEVGNDMQDFSTYVRYYEHRIGAHNKSDAGKVRLKFEIEKADVGKMVLEKEILRLAAIK